MSYTELEHGYQDLRSTSRPIFYVGDINTVQPDLVDPVSSSLYRSSKRGELSDGCSNEDGCMGGSDLEGEGKQVLVGVCAMAKKSQSKPMKEILTRLEEFEYIKILVFPEEVILKEPVEDWPVVDCLISFHSKGFPLDKAIHYANLRNPFIINNLPMQYDIQDRRRVYAILDSEGIEIPRYAVLDRDSADPKHHELVESEDHVEVNGVTFNKPFVEKPVSAEDHNIYIYYPTSAGGGSQRLFRKIGSRSSVYSPESRVRKTGSYIYEDFMPTDGTDVKVYTVGPDYAHAEARKSPALDGKVERDSEGKEIRYPVILSNAEKLISRKVCLAFKQTVCGFDLLRANGKSFVCDVNGFSFVKNSNKYYDDCAKILGNMILRELAPTLHIPWSVPFQLDDPPIVPTTFGKMMELRCVVAVIRHGDRTPKQKMKVEVRHPKFFEIFAKYDGYKHGHVKLKRPKQLQEILDTARSLLTEIQHRAAGPELEEKQGKLEQLKSVLEMYGHFSGINRKVQMKYQPRGRPRGSSSDDGNSHNRLGEPSLVLILKWGGELTPAGRIQAEELGRIFRCMYPGGQGRHLSGEYAGAQGLGLLRLHSTFRHDLKIYASDEGRVQMTAAAFAKGLLALEGELTPILVQMVKSANTNGLLDNDCDSSKYQNMVKTRLHELLQQDREFTREDREQINPGNALSINDALDFVKNPVKCCQHVQVLIQKLMDIVRIKKDDPKTKDAILYHGETWELMGRRWGKIEKDFCTKNKRFDISKIPDIYDCIKYDLQHNNHTLQFDHAEELYIYAKYLADIVIPQEYGLTVQEKLTIGQGICTPLLKKIRADLQRNIEESGEETVNRLNPRYSHGVSSPGRHVRTRLYFTSESHVHSLLTVLRYGGLLDVVKDEQWRRAMEYVSMVSELNYMSQIVVMLYEDPTKDPSSEERFHVELHFSPGVNCCVQKNLPPGPGFRPHSRNESSHNLETNSQCSTRIDEEDSELGGLDDSVTSPHQQSDTSPVLAETEETPDTTLDSPTTSRAIDMMDLDPNMMDEPYDSGFLQASAPIPISARTVAGHEAARLGSQLAASQRQRREREASGICEPRARSYDHQRQEKTDKNRRSPSCLDIDDNFYEKIENLVTPKSCHDASTNDSLSSSSPNLLNRFPEPGAPKDRVSMKNIFEQTSLANISTILRKNVTRSVKSASENFSIENPDSWDFGDTQLLEESPKYEDIKITDEKTFISEKDRERDKIEISPTVINSMEKKIVPDEFPDDRSTTSPLIERSEPRDTPRETISRASERHCSIARSTSYLGIPISLPHSVSSPELPAPIVKMILENSGPLVTLHNDSLSSSIGSTTLSPPSFERSSKNDKTTTIGHCPTCNLVPVTIRTTETKRYGRSKSALTLSTGNDPSGESGFSEITDLTSNLAPDRFPIDNCPSSHHQIHRAKFSNCRPKKYVFNDLRNDSSAIEESVFDRSQSVLNNNATKSFGKYSTSLPSPSRSFLHKNSLDVPFNEIGNHFASSYVNSRRASLTFVPDQHFSDTKDNLLRRGDQRFSKRSRSLSPCLQPCQCYNCNVSALIRQSVDLPPDERSNFETYFVTSLSHKFDNCRCYEMSVENAKASRRISRSASPNSTTSCESSAFDFVKLPISRSFNHLDLRNLKKIGEFPSGHLGDGRMNELEFLSKEFSSSEPQEIGLLDLSHPIDHKESSINLNFPSKIWCLPDVGSSGSKNVIHCSDDRERFGKDKRSDRSLPIGLFSLKVSDHSDVDENKPISSLKSLEKSDSTIDPVSLRTLVDKMASDRRLSRQLSCPTIVVDSSDSFDCPLSNDRQCFNSLRERDTFSYTKNRLTSRRTGSIVSRFLMPDRKLGEAKFGANLCRKFSCPEIIVESSSYPETSEPEDNGESKYAYQRDVDLRNEGDSKNLKITTDQRLERSRNEKFITRQASCPEITEYSRRTLLHARSSKTRRTDECSGCRLHSLNASIPENYRFTSIENLREKTYGTRYDYPISCCYCLCLNHDRNTNNDRNIENAMKSYDGCVDRSVTIDTCCKDPRHMSSPTSTFSSSSNPRLQTQRSFSSPDTRPSIIQQPDPTCTARRHRHGISGQMSYFKLLGYNVSKKLTGSTNSLFSTAVISGSSSAPNLKDMVPAHASAVAAIEGFGGVPPIRPLETLHNALSLRQLDSFLDMMTNASLFRTPASSPPKFPSPGGSIHGGTVIPNLSICSINREYQSSDLEAVRYITPTPIHYKSGLDGEGNDNRNQLSPTSPNSAGWSSEPQSFLSSGQSSPAPTSAGECSMSMSLVSNDGTQPFVGSKVSIIPCLDIDFNDFYRTIDQEIHVESRGSISYTDYYSNEDGLIRKSGPDLTNLRERAAQDKMSHDSNVDDDEEHTLTLREAEEHRKQDVKFIFDQNKDSSLIKPSSSYKKIGRFRVESMEISDEDVRIKEAAGVADSSEAISISSSNLSLDRAKTVSNLVREKSGLVGSIGSSNESQDTKKSRGNFATMQNRTRQRVRTIARSQSVSTPQHASRRTDVDYVCQASDTNTGSFSTMSCEDLENWKLTAASPPASSVTSPTDVVQEEPILTLASSLKGRSNIIVGFNVQDDKKD